MVLRGSEDSANTSNSNAVPVEDPVQCSARPLSSRVEVITISDDGSDGLSVPPGPKRRRMSTELSTDWLKPKPQPVPCKLEATDECDRDVGQGGRGCMPSLCQTPFTPASKPGKAKLDATGKKSSLPKAGKRMAQKWGIEYHRDFQPRHNFCVPARAGIIGFNFSHL